MTETEELAAARLDIVELQQRLASMYFTEDELYLIGQRIAAAADAKIDGDLLPLGEPEFLDEYRRRRSKIGEAISLGAVNVLSALMPIEERF